MKNTGKKIQAQTISHRNPNGYTSAILVYTLQKYNFPLKLT